MKKYKNQKGSISLFVLLSMMFFLAFMLGAFSIASRRNMSQVEALQETQAIYKSRSSATDIYDSIVVSTDSVVPISNKEQLATVAAITATPTLKSSYMINGKLYTYSKDANYVLQNDIILDLDAEITGKKNITIYDYMLYSDSYNIDMNGYDIYYAQKDGSLWKCIFYHYVGASKNQFFSTDSANSNYYGKSYSPDLYSILAFGVDTYKKAWDDTRNFEFMLIYNSYSQKFDATKYKRWRQTNNPSKETVADGAATTVAGYTAEYTGGTVAAFGTANSWGGLARSTRTAHAYLDGAIGDNSYYFAVGATDTFGDYGIPVTNANYGGAPSASAELLFVRVK